MVADGYFESCESEAGALGTLDGLCPRVARVGKAPAGWEHAHEDMHDILAAWDFLASELVAPWLRAMLLGGIIAVVPRSIDGTQERALHLLEFRVGSGDGVFEAVVDDLEAAHEVCALPGTGVLPDHVEAVWGFASP